MCLTVPLQVVKKLAGNRWQMETGRVVRNLVKNIRVGDYLICQQDLGIEKVTKNKAQIIRKTLKLSKKID